MSELIATLGAMHEKENRHNKFLAAIQGIDLSDKQQSESATTTLEQVQARAMKRLTGSDERANAILHGFDGEDGTGYSMIGVGD